MRQNPSNDENAFENLFPSITFIQSLTGSDVEDVYGLSESSLEKEEEPCCRRNINPVIERKVYFPICNNPFISVSTIKEAANLCLENNTKFFFERQPESSNKEKSVSMTGAKTEMKEHLDQTQHVSVIYRQNEWRKWTHCQCQNRGLL